MFFWNRSSPLVYFRFTPRRSYHFLFFCKLWPAPISTTEKFLTKWKLCDQLDFANMDGRKIEALGFRLMIRISEPVNSLDLISLVQPKITYCHTILQNFWGLASFCNTVALGWIRKVPFIKVIYIVTFWYTICNPLWLRLLINLKSIRCFQNKFRYASIF